MCGVVGILAVPRKDASGLAATVNAMAATLRHRGPDDGGAWVDPAAGVALGHRRLSVVELSALGHQPMVSSSGRWVLSFNGEVYNFSDLRKRLKAEGRRFRGLSDTEVLLEAVDAWGVETTLERTNAMFALALWDRARRELHLARDRIGEKPLYYAWGGTSFLFASELKAITAHPDFRATIDRNALALYMRHNCVPAPHSIYQDAGKLLPGHRLVINGADLERRQVSQQAWWSAASAIETSSGLPAVASSDAVALVRETLLDSVRLRCNADVPVGALLSGGIDSSLIVALMRTCVGDVRTFTVGFEDVGYDESLDAARVARHLETDHTEIRVGTADAQAVIPRLADLYDEPFGDSSQIPTVLVAELARRHVTVVLSGDGGDELFAGYNRHLWCARLARVPQVLRRYAAAALAAPAPDQVEAAFGHLGRLIPSARVRNPSLKVGKLAEIAGLASTDEMYRRLVSHWPQPEAVVLQSSEPPAAVSAASLAPLLTNPVERMLFLDMVTYLPDDILTKLDRATMAVGLEGRVPLLDHRVVESAWRLPLSAKLHGGQTKWVLRNLLDEWIPRDLIDRPKMGFGVPLRQWLRTDLRPWAEDLLSKRRLESDGYFSVEAVTGLWHSHLAGETDASHAIWDVLMFQAWLRD